MKRLLISLIFILLLMTACSEGDTEVKRNTSGGNKVTEEDVLTAEKELENINKEIEDRRRTVEALKETITEREQELEELERQMAGLIELEKEREELERVSSELEDARIELESLKNEIITVKNEPIEVGAGQFYFGEDADIPINRYKIVPKPGNHGNVIINNREGENQMRKFLNSGDDDSYVIQVLPGYKLETDTPLLLYPLLGD